MSEEVLQKETSQKEIKYQVKAKRDAAMIKSFITFTYRVKHPKVTSNFIIWGIVVFFIPFTASGHPVISGICFAIGAFMVLMGLFRQYIPLTMMKKRDTDYIEGVVTTYNFGKTDIEVYRNDELLMIAGSYQKIHSFYSDEYYYYIGMNEDDLFVLPKSCFTIGDSYEFQTFISEKSQVECSWIPVTLKNKFIKVRARFSGQVQQFN
jgi:hypothetical protein